MIKPAALATLSLPSLLQSALPLLCSSRGIGPAIEIVQPAISRHQTLRREGNNGAHGSGRSARFPNVFRTLASMIVYLLSYDYRVLFFKAFSMSNVHFNKRRDRPCPPSNGGGAVGGKFQAERFAAAAAAFAIFLQDEPGRIGKKSGGASTKATPQLLIQFNLFSSMTVSLPGRDCLT